MTAEKKNVDQINLSRSEMAAANKRPTLSKRSDTTRNQILDSAVECYKRYGINETSIQQISATAQVSRTTLYRHFKNQEQIMSQAIIRDIYGLLEQLATVQERYHSIEDKVIEGVMYCLTEMPRRTLLASLIKEQTSLINRLSLLEEDFNELGAIFCRPVYELAKEQGRVRDDISLELFVEWVTRILMSLQSTPHKNQHDNIKMRQFLKSFLIPSIFKARK